MTGKKYYCYIDETGQDSQGKIFIVAVVIPEDRDNFESFVLEVEKTSGKGKFKWGRADKVKRLSYLRSILQQKKFPFKSFYSMYSETKEYKSSTILTIAKAISSINNYHECEFTVLVDALNDKDQRYYGSQLHRLKLPVKKIRGIRKDENSAVIRFADSLCGFVRDVKENNQEDGSSMVESIMEV